jgi:GT2 family glycosyltransferase
MRSQPLLKLLQSVKGQICYPDEILIIDGSTNNETQKVVVENPILNLHYFKVPPEHRGLTKQRNYGMARVHQSSEIVCFLDDDTVLVPFYFEEIIKTFKADLRIIGVGGVAINENTWKEIDSEVTYNPFKYYVFEGYVYMEGSRNVVRNYLGLQSNLGPGKMPVYSHGRTCGFPLNDKTYEVDLLIGMSMAFRKTVTDVLSFSPYFEGYGLYEDADFSLRALKYGKNVINTKAQLAHYHAASGRPNQYQYGKMVVRNGWYVWRVKNSTPSWNDALKWHAITLLLTGIRATNIFTTFKRKEALTETIGRIVGWFSLWVSKPKESK